MKFNMFILCFISCILGTLLQHLCKNEGIIPSLPSSDLSLNVKLADAPEIIKWFIASCLIANAREEHPEFVAKKIDDMLIELIRNNCNFTEFIKKLTNFYCNHEYINKPEILGHLHTDDDWFKQVGTTDLYYDIMYINQFKEINKYAPCEFFAHAIGTTKGFTEYYAENERSTYPNGCSGLLKIYTGNFELIGRLIGEPLYFTEHNKDALTLVKPPGLVGTCMFWINDTLKIAKNIQDIVVTVQSVNKGLEDNITYTESSLFFKTIHVLQYGWYKKFIKNSNIDEQITKRMKTFHYLKSYVSTQKKTFEEEQKRETQGNPSKLTN